MGIRNRLLESADGGRTWTEGNRTVPDQNDPTLLGMRDGMGAPAAPPGWRLTFVHVGPDRAGLAAGCESGLRLGDPKAPARFWRTGDGVTWDEIAPDIGRWGRMRAWPSWPPEEVDTLAVLNGGLLAFAWEDPWLHENPHSHLVLWRDGEPRWRYVRLPDGCSELATGPGPLRVFGPGRVVVRSASGSFRRESIKADWSAPSGYYSSPSPWPGRLIQFTSESEGFAIRVMWPRDDPPRTPQQLPPPLVGLTHTQDGGRRWEVMTTWEGPRAENFNRRHEVTLEVR